MNDLVYYITKHMAYDVYVVCTFDKKYEKENIDKFTGTLYNTFIEAQNEADKLNNLWG